MPLCINVGKEMKRYTSQRQAWEYSAYSQVQKNMTESAPKQPDISHELNFLLLNDKNSNHPVGGFILSNGSVLVLPDYNNDRDSLYDSKIAERMNTRNTVH